MKKPRELSDRPVRVSLTEKAEETLKAIDAAMASDESRIPARVPAVAPAMKPRRAPTPASQVNTPAAAAALGRSPAVLPSQKQGAPERSAAAVTTELAVPLENDCMRLLQLRLEWEAARRDFQALAKPLVSQLASLSHNQVRNFEAALEPTSKRVKEAKARMKKHQTTCARCLRVKP
jgi:hypothetical protein